MSRSQHTRPRRIRAVDRLRNPRKARGDGDPSRARRLLRELKELGISTASARTEQNSSWRLPKISETRPRPGHHHPATKKDIVETLQFFGEECVYGLRSVELRQGIPGTSGLQLGRLLVPGRIVLYDQLPSPWHLSGRLDDEEERRFLEAGAEIETLESSTLVHWSSSGSLRDFMLFDVLMHEIGHHLLQHHKGKRTVRIARTRDHESFANAFARKCRETFRASREGLL